MPMDLRGKQMKCEPPRLSTHHLIRTQSPSRHWDTPRFVFPNRLWRSWDAILFLARGTAGRGRSSIQKTLPCQWLATPETNHPNYVFFNLDIFHSSIFFLNRFSLSSSILFVQIKMSLQTWQTIEMDFRTESLKQPQIRSILSNIFLQCNSSKKFIIPTQDKIDNQILQEP